MPDDLREIVAAILQRGEIAKFVSEVELESDLDEFGDEFLRVVVRLKPTDKDIDEALESVLEQIEDAIAKLDDRFPSVRFLDAA
ncbi:MAG: hypothetical protein K2W91_13615 [Novosphingobium sp.]|nr:hypothetical protein [Novosphingobium sp.]